MPRANRYIVPGYTYHLTHRCHDREFLLRFAKDRQQYRTRLREALHDTRVSLLTYNITRNHVHLLAYAEEAPAVASMIQQAAGEFARDYNRRKDRTGAFWEGRYHATMVDSGGYLWQCLLYVELNMVRCGAVAHPSDWEWSGFGELMGRRRRNRLLDTGRLLELSGAASMEEFRAHFVAALERKIAEDRLRREPRWTESLAVGSEVFIEGMRVRISHRQHMESVEVSDCWVLREDYE